jgi:pullulanase/glycogen debranching enzyme
MKLVDLEQNVYEIKAQLELMQSRFAEVLTSRGQTDKLSADVSMVQNEFEANIKRLSNAIMQLDRNAVSMHRKLIGMEQSLAALGKITTGLTKSLTTKGLTSDEEIMNHVREFDDESQQKQIEDFLANKIISTVETANEDSILVVRQENKTTNKLVSNYRIVDLSSLPADHDLRKAFLGKKAGDIFVYESAEDKESHLFTIKGVYALVQSEEIKAEDAAPAQANSTENNAN